MIHHALVIALVGLSSQAALAADRCGGVKLEAGSIRLGKPVTEDWVKTAEGQGCLQDLVKELERYRLVRAVTVAAIVTDADRASGKGLASAKSILRRRLVMQRPEAARQRPGNRRLECLAAGENRVGRERRVGGRMRHVGKDFNVRRPRIGTNGEIDSH